MINRIHVKGTRRKTRVLKSDLPDDSEEDGIDVEDLFDETLSIL
jgi:hypothetical protein